MRLCLLHWHAGSDVTRELGLMTKVRWKELVSLGESRQLPAIRTLISLPRPRIEMLTWVRGLVAMMSNGLNLNLK